jgi:hypothetical protein
MSSPIIRQAGPAERRSIACARTAQDAFEAVRPLLRGDGTLEGDAADEYLRDLLHRIGNDIEEWTEDARECGMRGQ